LFGRERATANPAGFIAPPVRMLGPSYENKSQVGKIALAISAFRS